MIALTNTQPYGPSDVLQQGDVLAYPDGQRLFYVQELFPDGAYGGDLCLASQRLLPDSWVEMTRDEMVALGLRLAGGPSFRIDGSPN